ncbi:type II toxin-antitoxin system VapC family toxin [Nodosilinea nodulosa]|uniref:type II toxin-antitoxin system VapC family toxin n=1 Tax=Nodosilinea nodulosa TaxID=416001 RepID=UPI000362C6FC|nr:type II toxin-antitoxin system VapC family toxin [Nodosilinea nodulosa]
MANYLLDTNVALRLADLSSPQNALVTDAVATLLEQQHVCYLSPQVITELWVVATRPAEVNGLGWSAARTTEEIARLMDEFPLIEESQQIFSVWLNLVTALSILGKRAHDARIAAIMLEYGVTHLLTFNTKDFIQVPGIIAVDPQAVVSPS